MEINKDELLNSLETYLNYVENKEWWDLTNDEVENIRDSKLKHTYQKKRMECLKYIINPLYDSIQNRSRFKFSHDDRELTCKNMLQDLFNYYKKKGFEKDEIFNIARDRNSSKKY